MSFSQSTSVYEHQAHFSNSESSTELSKYKVKIVGNRQPESTCFKSQKMRMSSQQIWPPIESRQKCLQYRCFKCSGKDPQFCRQCSGKSYISSSHPIVGAMEQIFGKLIANVKEPERKELSAKGRQIKKETLLAPRISRSVISEQSFSAADEQQAVSKFESSNAMRAEEEEYKQDGPDNFIDQIDEFQTGLENNNWISKQNEILSSLPKLENLKKISEKAEPEESFHEQCKASRQCSNCRGYFCSDSLSCSTNKKLEGSLRLCLNCAEQSKTLLQQNQQLQKIQKSYGPILQSAQILNRHFGMKDKCEADLRHLKVDNSVVDIYAELSQSYEKWSEPHSWSLEKEQKKSFVLTDVDFDEVPEVIDIRGRITTTDLGERRSSLGKAEKDKNCQTKSKQLIKEEVQIKGINQYIFEDVQSNGYEFKEHRCHFCFQSPIKNKRFHCGICDKFDVCQSCFKSIQQLHKHEDFVEVRGDMIIENRQNQLKRILQKEQKTSQTAIPK